MPFLAFALVWGVGSAGCGKLKVDKSKNGGLYMKMTAKSLDELDLLDSEEDAEDGEGSASCSNEVFTPLGGDPVPFVRCKMSPDSLSLGIVSVAFVAYPDLALQDGGTRINELAVTRVVAYKATPGEVLHFDVSEEEGRLPINISAVPYGLYKGLQLELGYIQQKFPDDPSIAENLRGRSYRICISDGSCGAVGARAGDYLVQKNFNASSDEFQYLNFSGCDQVPVDEEDEDSGTVVSCSNVTTVKNRPNNYAIRDSSFEGSQPVVPGTVSSTVGGFYAPIYVTGEEIDVSGPVKVSFTFSTHEIFEWNDGAMQVSQLNGSQKQPLIQKEHGTVDVSSPEVFKLIDDNLFFQQLPLAEFGVQPVDSSHHSSENEEE